MEREDAAQGRARERRSVIAAARQAGVPDGVFEVMLFNSHRRNLGPPPHAAAIALEEVFPALCAAELREPADRAIALIRMAYDAGDAVLGGLQSAEEAVARLKRECPGFSDGVYDQTIGYGCFLAR